MADLVKYGVEYVFLVPIIKRGVLDFSATGDWTPATGDVKISQNEGAFSNIGTLPTAVGNHWKFTVSATELQTARVVLQVIDSATKAVEDQAIHIHTYGNASAQHAFDLDTAEQSVNIVKISGDSGAADNLEAMFDGNGYIADTAPSSRVQVTALAADVADVKAETVLIVADTNELQLDDVPGLISALNNLSAATLFTTQMVESYAVDGAAPTLAQVLLMILQQAGEFAIAGTTITTKKLDGSATAMTHTLNDASNPTSRTRAT